MQLSDILEENSVKMMVQKTKISEENLENLLAKKFEYLKKVKTMGFISILEREYKADLTAIRQEANDYYNVNNEDRSVTLGTTGIEEKKGKSGFFFFMILLLLAYATWYFFTQFDKKHLGDLLPFIDEETIESFVGDSKEEHTIAEDLSIAKVNAVKKEIVEKKIVEKEIEEINTTTVIPKPTVEVVEESTSVAVEVVSTSEDMQNETTIDEPTNAMEESETSIIEEPAQEVEESPAVVETVKNESIRIVPARRLWFGMIDTKSKKRKNLTISKPYSLDVRSKSWLIATSIAPFSIVAKDDKKSYKNGRSHYFKIDADGIHVLTKRAYVKQGGYRRW